MFDYLGSRFAHELPCCPVCGRVFISAELAEGRMALLLKRISEGLALMMGCIGSCALLLFFSVYSLLRAVVQ